MGCTIFDRNSHVAFFSLHSIAIGQTGRASDHVRQHVMVLPNVEAKKAWLLQMLPILVDVGLTLVFVATRVECESLAECIRKSDPCNVKLATLHGDKHATDRQAALRAFTKGQVNALIATDVAARGLDTNVATVISFDPAKNLDVHVHRIGRAGRLAKDEQEYREGTAYTLLTKKDADFAHVLKNSFARDNCEISPELQQLAQTSRRSGSGSTSTSRDKWNKAGLGFEDASTESSRFGPATTRPAVDTTTEGSYYGPASSSRHVSGSMPVAKKSRWG